MYNVDVLIGSNIIMNAISDEGKSGIRGVIASVTLACQLPPEIGAIIHVKPFDERCIRQRPHNEIWGARIHDCSCEFRERFSLDHCGLHT